MRPKIVILAALAAALILAAALGLNARLGEQAVPTTPQAATSHSATSPAASVPAPAARRPIPNYEPRLAVPSAPSITPEERQAAIETELSRLQALSSQADPICCAAILDDLTHSEKQVRLAAIEAAKQTGNQDAIPVLKADAAASTNLDEQIAMLKAAEFLSLPSISEIEPSAPQSPDELQASQQRLAQSLARKQTFLKARLPEQTALTAPVSDAPPPPGN